MLTYTAHEAFDLEDALDTVRDDMATNQGTLWFDCNTKHEVTECEADALEALLIFSCPYASDIYERNSATWDLEPETCFPSATANTERVFEAVENHNHNKKAKS